MTGDEIRDPIANPNPNSNPDSNPESNRQAVERTAAGVKRKRNLPGTPDPEAEVIALSPEALLSSSTFVCEVCGKEFRRDQNLQIHRRGHNLPWNFPQKKAAAAVAAAAEGGGKEAARKRVYVCPEETCVYHDPARALGDLTGIKKHYSRKHGEKKWKCDKCSKKYAVRTDWKAHTRICGNREYECLCGTLFSRKDSFVVHRASCEATAESPAAATVDLSFRANTVNNELLFPSLWGQSSSQSTGAREEQRQVEQGHDLSSTNK
ncbi:zinc finger protein BALDIBIS [Elaeis guineensis]|uniref:Zinc finger protein BALDIBIS n=1 Tax=Elaeis guineensis var. tenera TaxID=51953 RepID=A0A6I9R9G2_ELAGV|nr:zinc finger protein BALDIBIS [Elaeis guineensis]